MKIKQIAQNLAQKIKEFIKWILSYYIEFSLIRIDSNQNPPPQNENQLTNSQDNITTTLDFTQNSVESKTLLAEFALNIWRIDSKVKTTNLPQTRAITSSIKRIYELLEKHQITIKDYTNTKYNDGLNIDVVECKQVLASDSADISEMIIETLSPSIIIDGELYKKAKVIKETKILKE